MIIIDRNNIRYTCTISTGIMHKYIFSNFFLFHDYVEINQTLTFFQTIKC